MDFGFAQASLNCSSWVMGFFNVDPLPFVRVFVDVGKVRWRVELQALTRFFAVQATLYSCSRVRVKEWLLDQSQNARCERNFDSGVP